MIARWPCVVVAAPGIVRIVGASASAECSWVWWSSSIGPSARPLAIEAQVR
jgi:hypothetical protein